MQFFHLYGLLIGIGILIGWWLVRRQVVQFGRSADMVDAGLGWAVLPGIVGARLWHVATSIPYYLEHLAAVPALWQGGLSIFGGLLFGASGVALWLYRQQPKTWRSEVLWWLDIAVFGVPVAQAVGRLGNFLNQELYGLPTTLPWGLYIDQAHRWLGFEQFSHFHPLFAYEAVALLVFAGYIWKKTASWQIGSGKLCISYLVFYAWLRVGLDSLRLEKALVAGTSFGINQVIMGVVGSLGLWWLWRQRHRKVTVVLLGLIIGWLTLCVGLVRTSPTLLCISRTVMDRSVIVCPTSSQYGEVARDRHRTWVRVGQNWLWVELVNQPDSITQGLSGRTSIGSDGMLFVFNTHAYTPTFWMKDMLFGLDLVWINENKIVDISANVVPPAPGTPDQLLRTYRPNQPADLVLEVPAGTAATAGWYPGSPFEWYH